MFAVRATRILAAMVAQDLSTLFDEIETMLAEAPRGGAAAVARVEQTLTDGYARALALEAERWRLERRLGEVARSVGNGDPATATRELTSLTRRLEDADGDLRRLRERLASLRRYAHAVRTA